jgi:hypothetical protein
VEGLFGLTNSAFGGGRKVLSSTKEKPWNTSSNRNEMKYEKV